MSHQRTYFPCPSTRTQKKKGEYVGADGNPIDNLGSQTVTAKDANGLSLQLEFDVAKLTKPLASVYSITRKGNKVVFGENGGYILNVHTNQQTPLRLDGKLYYLDLWIEVPETLVRSSPFIRQHGR